MKLLEITTGELLLDLLQIGKGQIVHLGTREGQNGITMLGLRIGCKIAMRDLHKGRR